MTRSAKVLRVLGLLAWLALPATGIAQEAATASGAAAPKATYSRKGADTCIACHDDGKTLSIFRTPHAQRGDERTPFGHGNLQCEACHNSTHAEFTDKSSVNGNSTNDNLRSIEAQGYVAALRECTACHGAMPTSISGGPHGMHTVGQSWVGSHGNVAEGGKAADCSYCHGSTPAGSDLAVIKVAKTFNVDDGRSPSKVLWGASAAISAGESP